MEEGYREILELKEASFVRIHHADAMVAAVFRVEQKGKAPLVLKIIDHPGQYQREAYFLKRFASSLPVPQLIRLIPPEAILMECLPGTIASEVSLSKTLLFEIGATLAFIHENRTQGYGDLATGDLTDDPLIPFRAKFEEGLRECEGQLPQELIDAACRTFSHGLEQIESLDGPCVIHRDYRAGNIMVHEGELQGVIDWSSAKSGFAEADFVPLAHGEWPDGQETFLEGYASIRPLPSYEPILPLLILDRAVGAVGFTIKRGIYKTTHAAFYKKNLQIIEELAFSDL